MTPGHREALRAPSEWDVVLSPELGPLFVLEAAIVAAHRFLSAQLDPSSSQFGGANHRPTRALLHAMRTLRTRIRDHRFIAHALAHTPPPALAFDHDRGLPQVEDEDLPF